MKQRDLLWHDPFTAIWGFHVHQELPQEQFARALAIQQRCHDYLEGFGVQVDAADSMRPGYGPHLQYMWELRVENQSRDVLKKMGHALSFLAVNRFGMSGYLHALRHDPRLDEDLATEGRLNQHNTLWFGERVPQHQEFFFDPPRDDRGKIVDTRTPRLLSPKERAALRAEGERSLPPVIDPRARIVNGFHLHLDYLPSQRDLAMEVFDRFVTFLLAHGLRPTSTRLYAPGENGPHLQAGWEVKFETPRPEVQGEIGIAVGWLMCNRQDLSVSLHPVTWHPGDVTAELKAHEDYWMFIGELPALDLGFFRAQLPAISI